MKTVKKKNVIIGIALMVVGFLFVRTEIIKPTNPVDVTDIAKAQKSNLIVNMLAYVVFIIGFFLTTREVVISRV